MEQALQHHGILGQKWGVRRTPEQLGHLSKKDSRWVAKKSDKITAKAKKQSQRELNKYSKELMREPGATNKNGQLSAKTINAYNRRMAELMSTKVSDLRSPSGKVVTFVAKRGEVGVFMALADEGYNMQQLRNGVYDSGRIAYKKDVIDKVEHSAILHHGVKGQKWGVRNGPPYPLKNAVTSAQNYDIIDPASEEIFHLSEGTRIRNPKVFAGKGTSKPLEEATAEGLSEQLGGSPDNWQHCKGLGTIDYYGEDREAEIHWFQEETVGKHKFKVKEWLDD